MKTIKLEAGAAAVFEKDEEKRTRFSMLGYSGKPMITPFGKVVINLQGMTPRSPATPVFQHHDRRLIVGHSDKLEISENVLMSGTVSGTGEAAKEVVETSANGFPWQASVGVDIFETKMIKAGDKEMVNNFEVEGPAMVLDETELSEISFVPLGMDRNTQAVAFSKDMENELTQLTASANEQTKEAPMADETTLTEEQHVEALEAAKADAMKEASERMNELMSEFPQEFALQAFNDGLSLEAAKAKYYDVQKAEIAELKAAAEELKAQSPVSDAGLGEESPVAHSEEPGNGASFSAKIAEIRQRDKCDEQTAIDTFAKENPGEADKILGLTR